jgi:hypothetical protein
MREIASEAGLVHISTLVEEELDRLRRSAA